VVIHGVRMEVESVLHHAVAWVIATPERDEDEEENGGEERDG